MLNNKQKYNEDLVVSLWFIPIIMCMFSVVLAYGVLYLDLSASLEQLKSYFATFIGPESFKQLLSVSSTSVITIVTITFSITILTLSIASNQLGPRLLPGFLEKKITQFTLGYLIGTFIYNMIVLQSISAENIFSYPPVLSVTVAFLLSIFSLFVFIIFIHFSSQFIQVDNALKSLASSLLNAIEKNNREKGPHKILNQSDLDSGFERAYSSLQYEKKITDKRSGYLQYIHYKKLLEIATTNNLKIDIIVKPGDYCVPGRRLMTIKSQKEISDKTQNSINDHIYFGKRRTTTQDIEFGFELLVEVALRALSPGINNPYTAIHCLDRISEGIVSVAKTPLEKNIICNQQNQAVIKRKVTSYQSIINVAFNQIRQKAKSDIAVTIYILKVLKVILNLKDLPESLAKELLIQAERVYENAQLSDMIEDDRNDIQYHYDAIQKATT